MKKHFTLCCVAYMMFGIGQTFSALGIKAGVGFWPTAIISGVSFIFFLIIVFTSMETMKKFIKQNDK